MLEKKQQTYLLSGGRETGRPNNLTVEGALALEGKLGAETGLGAGLDGGGETITRC